MKKSLLIVVLSLLLMIFGCEKKINTQRIAVMSNGQDNIVLLLDNANKVLQEKTIDGNYRFLLQKNLFFYSNDAKQFKSFDINDLSDSIALKNVFGYLLYVVDANSYVTYQDGKAIYVNNDQQKLLDGYLSNYISDDNYFYMLDYSNYLYVYNLSDFSLETKQRVTNSNYLNFVKIDGKVYLVNDYGYSLVEQNGCSTSFYYPNDFYQIDNCYGDLLFVIENKEEVVYRVSFNKNQMVLKEELDEIYYESLNFSDIFKDYYANSFQVIEYLEVY